MAAAKTTTPAAPKEEKPKADVKEETKKAKKASVLADLDAVVGDAAKEVEKAVKQVGGDIARGLAEQALGKLREATDLLARAEREDK